MEVEDVPVAAVVIVDVEGAGAMAGVVAGAGADVVTAVSVGSLFDIAMRRSLSTVNFDPKQPKQAMFSNGARGKGCFCYDLEGDVETNLASIDGGAVLSEIGAAYREDLNASTDVPSNIAL